MTEQAQFTRHDLEAKIVKRCWEDEAFRKEFTADPAGTFTKYLEVPAASLPKILVHAEEPGSWHIVLPAKPANAGALSDADLERVAAGATPTIPAVIITASAAAGSAAAGSAALTPSAAAVSALVVSYVTISAGAITAADGGW
jgi:hypothetical protein